MCFNIDDAISMNKLLETEKVTPVIDREFPLNEIREAMKYMEKGHTKGKVIINIGSH